MENIGDNAREHLKSLVERIERLAGERDVIGCDIKELFQEAKGNGFSTKVLRKVIALRKRDAKDRQEEYSLISVYCHALGMEAME